jgi:hypothetical protein
MLALRRFASMTRLSWLLILAVVLGAPAAGRARQASPAVSPRNASYAIDARLDPATRRLTGTERLTWRNPTGRPARNLRFHLYWNAWREPASTWVFEQRLGRNEGLAYRPAEDYGWIDISAMTRVTPDGVVNLLPRVRYVAPDDGNREDRTLLDVQLDDAIGPGETATLDVTWSARVPRTYARTGYIGHYFFLAHWFPKIGVLAEEGWRAHQFHAATEFFADFGNYDVSLTVPGGWVVGATGREAGRTDNDDGTTTHQYVQTDVHDFAWTTSPDFIERHDRFEEPGLRPVDLRLLLQPEHERQAPRHFAAVRATLRAYGSWFGPYPYSQLTIVDPVSIVAPATQGESTGGMEYPTLITAGTRWSAPASGTQPEAVTVHETGHQFWYGVVATNEVEHAWMDEGINTYATARVMAAAWPDRFAAVGRYFGGLLAWPYADVRWSRDLDGNRVNGLRGVTARDVPSTPTWQYWPGTAGATSYNKTALWLATLEGTLGWPVIERALRTHYQRGAFGHPEPADFFAALDEATDQDLSWFIDQVHDDAVAFDYAVSHVRSVGGFDDVASTVVVERRGDGVFPVDVEVRFADGTAARERWDGRAPWHAFTLRGASPAVSVQVDPDLVLQLDLNRTNNSWTARPDARRAATTWALRWFTWFEELLLTYAVLA